MQKCTCRTPFLPVKHKKTKLMCSMIEYLNAIKLCADKWKPEYLKEEKVLKSSGQTVCGYDFKISYSPEMQKLRDRIYRAYKEGRYEMPTVEEILKSEKDESNSRHVIDAMASEGMLVRLSHQYYIDKEAFDNALDTLMAKLSEDGSITLAEFRDMLGTSRKYAMAILDYLDQQKITRKEGDARVSY